jgi:hypothetical protein
MSNANHQSSTSPTAKMNSVDSICLPSLLTLARLLARLAAREFVSSSSDENHHDEVKVTPEDTHNTKGEFDDV